MSLREKLRSATRDQHESLERLLRLDDPDLTLERYARFLQGMGAFTAAVEPPLAQSHGPLLDRMGVDLLGRSKLGWLDADLKYLGVERGVHRAPALDTQVRALGCAYVLEGATLGGAALYQRIASRFGLAPGRGATYLYGYGASTGAMWQRFVAMLDAAPLDGAAQAECADAARDSFVALEEGFRRDGWVR